MLGAMLNSGAMLIRILVHIAAPEQPLQVAGGAAQGQLCAADVKRNMSCGSSAIGWLCLQLRTHRHQNARTHAHATNTTCVQTRTPRQPSLSLHPS